MSDAVELVHFSLSDGVATITLDSPANRNALSAQLVRELVRSLRAADADPAVHAVVLTANGSTFCSGADLAEAVGEGMERGTRALLDLLRVVVELHKPVVADVRGHVRAGGVGLVGACDLALATSTSTFAFTEARLGLTPAIISLTTRSRMSEREAARKYLTGAVFDGTEAARTGLVTEVADPEAIDGRLAELLGHLRATPLQGLVATKRLLTAPMRRVLDTEGEAMVELSARLFASEVAREAMTAFRERRPSRRIT